VSGQDPTAPDVVKTAELTCPSCGEVVFPGEGFCEACGHRLGSDAQATAGADASQPGDGRSQPVPLGAPKPGGCVGCGTGTVDADGYCESCGLRQPAERDHMEFELPGGTAAAVSDRGKRYSRNEDAMAVDRHSRGVAAVVSDGVGSSPRPDEASRAAADTGVAELVARLEAGDDPEAAMHSAIARAAQAVAGLAETIHEAPSCTFVSAVTTPGAVTVGWVGDSRAYWLPAVPSGPEVEPPTRRDRPGSRQERPWADASPLDTLDMGTTFSPRLDGTARALTADDSWAAFMVAEGARTEAEAEAHPNAHVITGWLGADAEEVRPHVSTFVHDPAVPGTLLVCSDGLWNYLPGADDLAAVLAGASIDPAAAPLDAARALVRRALDEGGRDNITVAVIPLDPRPRSTTPPTSPHPANPPMEHER
jgi:serine/threonine protein phosphatase PrpC